MTQLMSLMLLLTASAAFAKDTCPGKVTQDPMTEKSNRTIEIWNLAGYDESVAGYWFGILKFQILEGSPTIVTMTLGHEGSLKTTLPTGSLVHLKLDDGTMIERKTRADSPVVVNVEGELVRSHYEISFELATNEGTALSNRTLIAASIAMPEGEQSWSLGKGKQKKVAAAFNCIALQAETPPL